jgi:hypothetical protein
MTYFTGEKFTTGQERFAPHMLIRGCSAPQAGRDAPGGEFIPACGGLGRTTRRVAPLARWHRIARHGAPNGSIAQGHEIGQKPR